MKIPHDPEILWWIFGPVTIIACAVVVVLAAAHGGDATPAPDDTGVYFAASPTQSEAYLVEQQQIPFAEHYGHILDALWMRCGFSHVDYSTWPDDRKLRLIYNGGKEAWIKFDGFAYDPAESQFTYGTTTTSNTVDKPLSGHSYLYDLTGTDEPGKFSQTDTVTLTQERSTTLSKTTDFNLSVENDTKVGGSFAGVGLEDTLKETVGFDFSTEYSQAESESKSKTESHTFDVDLAPRKATLIALDSPDLWTHTPFTANFVWDVAPKVTIGRPCGPLRNSSQTWINQWHRETWQPNMAHVWSHNNVDVVGCWGQPPNDPLAYLHIDKDCTFTFESIDRIDQMIRGTNERWPDMRGWNYAQIKDHLAYLTTPSNRHVVLSGTQNRQYQSSIREKVTDVTGQDLDDVLARSGATACDPGSSRC